MMCTEISGMIPVIERKNSWLSLSSGDVLNENKASLRNIIWRVAVYVYTCLEFSRDFARLFGSESVLNWSLFGCRVI